MILPCTCKHLVQDAMYGKGMRVHNQMKSGAYRCTVCKVTRGSPKGKEDNKKKGDDKKK